MPTYQEILGDLSKYGPIPSGEIIILSGDLPEYGPYYTERFCVECNKKVVLDIPAGERVPHVIQAQHETWCTSHV